VLCIKSAPTKEQERTGWSITAAHQIENVYFSPKIPQRGTACGCHNAGRLFRGEKGTPRGNYVTMGMFTVAILLMTLPVFVYLAVEGSKNTTTVSEVKSADLTGVEGWETCTMISKANDVYAPSDTSNFALVNVMESKTECAESLAAASPCKSEFNQISVSGSAFDWEDDAPRGLMVIDQSSNVWALNNVEYPTLTVYNPSDAAVTLESKGSTSLPGNPQGGASIVDMDSAGRVVSVYNITNGDSGLRYYDPSSETETFVELPVAPNAISVGSSDVVWFTHVYSETLRCQTKYNNSGQAPEIFKYDPLSDSVSQIASFTSDVGGTNVTSLNWLSVSPSGDLWGVTEENTNCGYESVNYDNKRVKIFKYDTTSQEISIVVDVTSYCISVNPFSSNHVGGPIGFTVDSNGIAWVSCGELEDTSGFFSNLVKYDTSSGTVSGTKYSSSSLGYLASDFNGGLYTIAAESGYLYKYDSTTESFVENLLSFKSGSYEWFVCGDKTLPGKYDSVIRC
jgi:sugar lactone lactonase YvrE